jgi:hypothetical protein
MDTDQVAGVGCCREERADKIAASTHSGLISLIKVYAFVYTAVELAH